MRVKLERRDMMVWPSGLRRQIKALVRKGGGSNPPFIRSFYYYFILLWPLFFNYLIKIDCPHSKQSEHWSATQQRPLILF